jgi:hypothetical protein
MSDVVYATAHGALRMSQRGIGADDVALASLIGTEVEGGDTRPREGLSGARSKTEATARPRKEARR